jgi:glucosyl-3-phosphoglycerate synthase
MSDFQQRGPITTLPRLAARDAARREEDLRELAGSTPVALIIPCLVTEMDQPALAGMVAELARVPYLDTVVISLDRSDEEGFRRAKDYFKPLRQRTVILWNEAPALKELRDSLEQRVGELPPGKGRAVWMAIGHVLAERRAQVIAFHDGDVVDYNRSLLSNLVFPLMHPLLGFNFSKGYYARFTDRLQGRVTRLLLRPLLQAFGNIVGHHPYLSYLAAFRYPLSGELALQSDLLRWIRIPGDWGLEVGLLFEVLRHRSPRRICQVDVADSFEHKHQPLSPDDASKGLHRMAVDIVKHLLRTLSASGLVLPEGSFKSMRVAYQRYAEDAVADYYAVAAFNELTFDRHAEEEAVTTFSVALAEGCQQFGADPLGTPSLPNWARVEAAWPEVGPYILQVVKTLEGILET